VQRTERKRREGKGRGGEESGNLCIITSDAEGVSTMQHGVAWSLLRKYSVALSRCLCVPTFVLAALRKDRKKGRKKANNDGEGR
jgi:hypothetical protein